MPAQKRPQPDDDEVQYVGFHRVDLAKSVVHSTKLEEDGLVYCGYLNTQDYSNYPPPPVKQNIKQNTNKKPDIIDLVSSDGEDERASSSAAGPSTTSTSSAPRSLSMSQASTSTQLSDKTLVNAPAAVHVQPKLIIRPTSPSARAKRATPGEFTIPGTSKRRKKEEKRRTQQRQSLPLMPIRSPKRTRSTQRSPSAAIPQDVIYVGDSSEDEREVKRARTTESPARQSISNEQEHTRDTRSLTVTTPGWETWLDQDFPEFLPSGSSPARGDEDDKAYDSEDDYAVLHDALNLNRSANWSPALPHEQSREWDDEELYTSAHSPRLLRAVIYLDIVTWVS
ncbi:uncharacterized protein B0H18DRAFT_971295 [Fomitopsis serialis]|uniref:uncharacterized protein n=1 Tax=Fomitopsis serialis TaxID=139415 RepID=UPI0020077275|nr:uncharacterized protein B0H18DRAFT_971295 [Neoantrodia serialis]KAH9937579.1 hypothetical protein B0H18DRAFT_971295 [Neoantrodia serialis]